MINRLFAAILLCSFAVLTAAPSYAIESPGERQQRRAKEATDALPKADEALSAKNYDLAISLYTKAIDGKGAKGEQLGMVYFKRGVAHQAKGDCASALADYDQAVQLVTTNGELWFNRSICHDKQGQGDQALSDLDAAIKANPDSAIYRVARCINLFNRKNFAGAIPDCEMALTAAPEDQRMLQALSQAYEQTGDKAKALEMYRRLLKLDPSSALASEGVKRLGG